MAIMVYNPGIRVVIDSTMAGHNIDISDDIVSGQVTINENGLHHMQINLLNKNRKYDHAFTPNDRFVIYMKRINELVVMTGYLNSVPLLTAWPRSIGISGYCANKRALYHFWDPGSMAAFNLMSRYQYSTNSTDSGLSGLAKTILTDVVGYQPSRIHIGNLPPAWLNSITSQYNLVNRDYGNSYSLLGGAGSIGGSNALNGQVKLVPGAELPTSIGTVTNIAPSGSLKFTDSVNDFWCAMQWGYLTRPTGSPNKQVTEEDAINFLKKQKLFVENVKTGSGVVVEPIGWGPVESPASTSNRFSNGTPQSTQELSVANAGICLSQNVLTALKLKVGDDVNIGWVDQNITNQTTVGYYSPTGIKHPSSPTSNYGKQLALMNSTRSAAATTAYTTGSAIGGQVATASGPAAAAANFAVKIVDQKTPYVFGAGRGGPSGWDTNLKNLKSTGVDCSALVGCAWEVAGVTLPGDSQMQYAQTTNNGANCIPPKDIQIGDLIFYIGVGDGGTSTSPGHVAMYIGNGQMAQASDPSAGCNITTAALSGNQFVGIGRVNTQGDTTNGSASYSSTLGVQNTIVSGANNGGGNQLITIWDWFGQGPDPLSQTLSGVRSLMNDQPVLPYFDMIIKAAMRSWCAAPNGDMMCWFPDYFNIYGTAAVMDVQAIELEDLAISWSDAALVTHQFVAGTSTPTILGPSPGGPIQAFNIATTMGIATVEQVELLGELFNLPADQATSKLSQSIIDRFGIRPNFQPMETLVSPEATFWYAVYLFQMNWANQFSATVPITFMPELYPGMIMRAVDFGFQAYVKSVTHTFDLTEGGGFNTEVTIMAPSKYGQAGAGLYDVVKGGYGGMM